MPYDQYSYLVIRHNQSHQIKYAELWNTAPIVKITPPMMIASFRPPQSDTTINEHVQKM